MKKLSFWGTLLFWIIAITGAGFLLKPQRAANMEAKEDALIFHSNSGYSITVAYKDMESVEYRENLQYGTLVDGVNEKTEKSGIWENEEFGEYRLCVRGKYTTCIVIHTEEEVIVVNFESEKSTKGLYEAILKQL